MLSKFVVKKTLWPCLENISQSERETPPYGNSTIGVLAGRGNISMVMNAREQLVLSLLEHCSPLIRKLALDWHLDYEDLRQDAAINIMKLIDDGKTVHEARNLPAVVSYCVRLRVLDKIRYVQRHQAVSLDIPVLDGSDETFADLLPAPYSFDPVAHLLIKERLEEMVGTVSKLKGNYGIAIRERYETALATYC